MIHRDTSGNSLRYIYQAVFRHRGKAALCFLAVVTAVALFTFLSPREYRSEGKLFVRLGRENATLDPTATFGQNSIIALPQSRENEINSVVEILQSRVLLEKVVDGLGPAAILNPGGASDSSDGAVAEKNAGGMMQRAGVQVGQVFAVGKRLLGQLSSTAGLDDRERAVLELGKRVKVEAAKRSNVIQIAYQGPTPKLSQTVVAKLIDSYLDEHLRLNRAHGSHEFFADQTNRLRAELSNREAELRDMKSKTGLASPAAQRELMVARIGRLEDELLHAESSRSVAEAKVRELREKLAKLPETEVTNETSGFNNEGTDRMREQFYALQVREKEAQAKYTDDHPKMQQIHEQIATSRAVLDDEERGRRQVTKEPSRLHHQVELSLLGEEPALASLDAEAEQLRSQLAAERRDLTKLNENELRLAALQREVDLIEADYRKYSANLEQARIDQQLESQRMSNISIAQPASLEPRPVRPRTMLNLLLGLLAGTLGGVALPLALEQLDRSVRTPEDIEKGLDLPTLAVIPRLKPRQLVVNGKG